MREIISTAPTVEEAVNRGCQQLGIEREDCQFEIITLPKKGFLGIGSSGAKVRVFIEEELDVQAIVKEAMEPEKAPEKEPEEKPAVQNTEKREKKPEKKAEIMEVLKDGREPISYDALGETERKKLETAKEYLTELLKNLGCDVQLVETIYEDGAVLEIEGASVGTVIGRRGETLDSIQYLTGLVANRGSETYYRITVDCQGYREKRIVTLQNLAVRMANKAVKTGRSTRLEPMNPFERRVIHAAVSTIEGAESVSYGEEPNRRVVISSKNRPPREERRGGKGGRYGDRRGRGKGGRSGAPKPKAETTPSRPARSDFDELGDLGGGLYGKIEL